MTVAARLKKIAFGIFSLGFSTSSVTVVMRSYPSNAMNVSPIAGRMLSADESSGNSGSKFWSVKLVGSPPPAERNPNNMKISRISTFVIVKNVSALPLAAVESAFMTTRNVTAIKASPN
jgi:hypothetical protein